MKSFSRITLLSACIIVALALSWGCTPADTTVHVSDVTMTQSSIELTVGETSTLTATISPSNATNKALIWITGNAAVATVNDGVVTAVGAGETTITAKSDDGGFTATCKVTVKPDFIAVTGISISDNSISLSVCETATLNATISPADATNKKITWSSSDASVATVDDNGIVTATGVGTAVITATSEDEHYTAVCMITVTPGMENGYEWADLGLPSGTKWATCNVGANSSEEYGDYFSWGETEPYYVRKDPLEWRSGKEGGYWWSSYRWCDGSWENINKYIRRVTEEDYDGNIHVIQEGDGRTQLEATDDAAHMILGGKWRIPSKEDWEELLAASTVVWTYKEDKDGRVYGHKITSNINGNIIFLPAAGIMVERDHWLENSYGRISMYWSSTLFDFIDFSSDYLDSPYAYTFNGINDNFIGGSDRCRGLVIRAVCD